MKDYRVFLTNICTIPFHNNICTIEITGRKHSHTLGYKSAIQSCSFQKFHSIFQIIKQDPSYNHVNTEMRACSFKVQQNFSRNFCFKTKFSTLLHRFSNININKSFSKVPPKIGTYLIWIQAKHYMHVKIKEIIGM